MKSARFLAILLFLAPLSAQQPSSRPPLGEVRKPTIQGEVRLQEGARVDRPVVVKLETLGGSQAAQSWTGSSGRFEFYQVPPGQYTLVVDSAGYRVVRQRIEYTFYPLEGIVLYLVADAAPEPLGDEFAIVDVSRLKIPSKALNHFEKGVAKMKERNTPESIEHFRAAIAAYPAFDDAYLQLTLAHFRTRTAASLAEAEKTLHAAVQANPQNWRALNVLSRVCRRQKRYEEAAQFGARSLAIKEDSWLAHVEMAEAMAGLNRFTDAGKHAARAHELNPAEPSIHQLYYNALIRQDQYPAALAELDEFIRLFPEHRLTPRAREQRVALAKSLEAKQ